MDLVANAVADIYIARAVDGNPSRWPGRVGARPIHLLASRRELRHALPVGDEQVPLRIQSERGWVIEVDRTAANRFESF